MSRTYRRKKERLPDWIAEDYDNDGNLKGSWKHRPETLKKAKARFHADGDHYYGYEGVPHYFRNMLEKRFRMKNRTAIHNAVWKDRDEEFVPFIRDAGWWYW